MGAGRFDALFIDFYGTLADGDRQAVEDTCARVVDDFHLDMTAPELAVIWGRRFFQEIEVANHERFLNLYECEAKTLVDTLRPWVGSIDPAPYCDMLKRYWASAPLQPESREVLAAIPIPVCCVSNADTEDLRAAVDLHGLWLDRLVTSEDVRCYKPDAKIFEAALSLMRVRPDRVLHVGDSLHSDVAGAAALGIATAWVCRDDRIFDAGDCEPNHKIRSLMELHDILP
jgi:2-haloacid dehalogenase/putative hydrolase of the HAD superfamily